MISAACLCGQLVLVFHSSWGPSLGGAELASRPSPLRPASVGQAFGGAAQSPGQPPAAPRLSRSSPFAGAEGGGGVPQPRAFPGVCLRLALEVSLVSRFRGGQGGDWRALRKPSGQD